MGSGVWAASERACYRVEAEGGEGSGSGSGMRRTVRGWRAGQAGPAIAEPGVPGRGAVLCPARWGRAVVKVCWGNSGLEGDFRLYSSASYLAPREAGGLSQSTRRAGPHPVPHLAAGTPRARHGPKLAKAGLATGARCIEK